MDNDSDPEGSPLTVSRIVGSPNPRTEGRLRTVDRDEGIFTFTPVDGFCDEDVTFDYVVEDMVEPLHDQLLQLP